MIKHTKPFLPENISSIEISYYTPDLPPPYCYSYLLRTVIEKDGLNVDFKLEYVEREDLEEEEILAEGFTLSDGFSFKGSLPMVWKSELIRQLGKTTFLKGNTDQYPIHLKVENKNVNEVNEGYPSDLNQWEYFLQEMVQGIFEAGKKERPLEIIYRVVDNKKQVEEISLKASFLSRTAVKLLDVNGKKQLEKSISFKELKKILKAVFMPDYVAEKALKKAPKIVGKYVNPGDGLWYEFGKGMLNPDPQYDSLKRIENLFEEAFRAV